jgi:hypothetical protein
MAKKDDVCPCGIEADQCTYHKKEIVSARVEGHEKLWTLKEYHLHLEKLEQALDGARPLITFMQKQHPQGVFPRRIPFGLINLRDEHGNAYVAPQSMGRIIFSPDLTIKPVYIVLSDETATSFNLCYYNISNCSQTGNGNPLPLEQFAVNYYAKALDRSPQHLEQLIQIQKWGSDIARPANRITMYVDNITDTPKQFRGILWADCQDWC